jgi:hypothetical protein
MTPPPASPSSRRTPGTRAARLVRCASPALPADRLARPSHAGRSSRRANAIGRTIRRGAALHLLNLQTCCNLPLILQRRYSRLCIQTSYSVVVARFAGEYHENRENAAQNAKRFHESAQHARVCQFLRAITLRNEFSICLNPFELHEACDLSTDARFRKRFPHRASPLPEISRHSSAQRNSPIVRFRRSPHLGAGARSAAMNAARAGAAWARFLCRPGRSAQASAEDSFATRVRRMREPSAWRP